MLPYILRRVLGLPVVLLALAAATFALMHAAPGGPWDRDPTRGRVDPYTRAVLNAQFGLDRPLWAQFPAYVIGQRTAEGWRFGAIGGNLGPSYRQRGRTVQQILFNAGGRFADSRFCHSLTLGLVALALAVCVGVPTGTFAAHHRNRCPDYIACALASLGVTVPGFVVGIVVILVFCVWLGIAPVVPRDWTPPALWILPAVTLSLPTMAYLSRLVRSSILETMYADHVRTATAKGLSRRRVLVHHVLRNAMLPSLTVIGPSLATLVGGSFVVESMFGFPGMGREYVLAVRSRDYSMIMGTTLIYGLLVAAANLCVDLGYLVLDPRMRS